MAVHPAESSPVFFARLETLGLTDLKEKFESKGWTSYADFAMACSDFTGKDPEKFHAEIIKPLLGDVEIRIPKVRRLFVQAYAAHAQLLEKMDQPAPDKPVQLHPLDREAAFTAVKAIICGIVIEGESEPSHALINRFAGVLSHGISRYEPWEKMTSRVQEINDVSEAPGLKLVESEGVAVFVPTQPNEGSADLSGEMRWDLAMRRRGLAMEISGLMSFDAHSLWHEAMRTAFLREPPPGYRRPTWAQLRNADRELWHRVASACPAGCNAKPGASKTAFEEAWVR